MARLHSKERACLAGGVPAGVCTAGIAGQGRFMERC